eukprot:m.83852 g.83852  ORF g.83852 m.83852 type:complete len:714 (-) comp14778_c0_seq1:35-2176(-)
MARRSSYEGASDTASSGAMAAGEIIRKGIKNRRQDGTQYMAIVSQLREASDPSNCTEDRADAWVAELSRWMETLLYCVSCLDRSATEIVDVILHISWQRLPETVLEHLGSFFVALVSAHSVYGQSCINTVVRQLVAVPSAPIAGPARASPCPGNKRGRGYGRDDAVDAARDAVVRRAQRRLVARHALTTLTRMVHVAPSQVRVVSSAVRQQWPHKRQPYEVQQHFLEHVLLLVGNEHLPMLREEVICVAVEQLVKLDVSVRDEPDAGEGKGGMRPGSDGERVGDGDSGGDGNDDYDDDTMFHVDSDFDTAGAMDTNGAANGADSGPDSESDDEDDENGGAGSDSLDTPAHKLDCQMVLFLDFVRKYVQSDAAATFEALWKGFERSVLPTYQSHHVQYLMFYACSFMPQLAEMFVARLFEKAERPETPIIIQQAAIAYIASFLSRAKFVPLELVKSSTETLASNIQEYIRTHQFSQVSRHLAFYAQCQAVFYLLCFRVSEFCESEDGALFLRGLMLDNVVASKFNPLKECQAAVVQEFARVMKANQILYCDTFIKRNSGHSVLSRQAIIEDTKVHGRLEDFFPFDPCFLKSSLVYIEPLYVTWQSKVGDDDSDDDSEDDDDIADASEDDFLPGSVPSSSSGGMYGVVGMDQMHHMHQMQQQQVMLGVPILNIPARQKRLRLDRAGDAATTAVDPGFFGSPLSPLNGLPFANKKQ